jgi:hypothetical protein
MAVVIGEIITETVLRPTEPQPATGGGAASDTDLDLVVRRAVERVLEVLRREWDR